MRTPARRLLGVVAAGLAATIVLAACTGDDGDTGDDAVTVTIGGVPGSDRPQLREAYEATVERFTADHPNVTIEADETLWEADTFQALLAGGTMPTTMDVPFTEIGGLIARGQIAEVGDYMAESETLSALNPAVLDVVSSDGGVWGVPYSAYTMGLLYNRALFEQAGLDPDSPPQTWDDVREAALAVQEATGVQGYAVTTLENTGGWILQTLANGFGGSLESPDGTEATVDGDGVTAALDFYRALRWEDGTLGANFLLNYSDALSLLASGQTGMMVGGSDTYQTVVTNLGMNPGDFGVAPLPQSDDGIGTLGGGTVTIFNPTATEAEIEAAVQFTEYWRFARYLDEDIATEQAAANAESGNAVGYPQLPVVSSEIQDRWLEWVAEYVNVPRDHFELYLGTVEEIPIVPEPATAAQAVYAALDPVVQAVLTREDADVAELLGAAQGDVQAIIDDALR